MIKYKHTKMLDFLGKEVILIFNQSADKKSAQDPYKPVFNIKLFSTAASFCLIFCTLSV